MLEVKNLKKNFGDFTAVKGVSFSVAEGEVLGFLGPNGAGKSTTMRMITGFLPPTEGTAVICGHDITADPIAAKAALGYLPESAPRRARPQRRSAISASAMPPTPSDLCNSVRVAHAIQFGVVSISGGK